LVRDRWQQARLVLADRGGGGEPRTFGLIVRVYDDGVAFRYELPEGSRLGRFVLTDEFTEVRFAADHRCWAGGESESAETQYPETTLSAIPRGEPGKPFRSVLPLLVETPAGFVAIAESDLLDWAGMSLTGTGGPAVKLTLEPKLGVAEPLRNPIVLHERLPGGLKRPARDGAPRARLRHCLSSRCREL
jgi:alpha-glucosidase